MAAACRNMSTTIWTGPDWPKSVSLPVEGCQIQLLMLNEKCPPLFTLEEAEKLCERSLIQVTESEKLTPDQ